MAATQWPGHLSLVTFGTQVALQGTILGQYNKILCYIEHMYMYVYDIYI